MVSWLERHSQAIQAAGALTMAAAALAAAIFVPVQIAANDRTTRNQAAREIYREFLNISIQQPDLARGDVCALARPERRTAYDSYVDYLLYTAEQVMDLNPADWETTIAARLQLHTTQLCGFDDADLEALIPALATLVEGVMAGCDAAPPCPGGKA